MASLRANQLERGMIVTTCAQDWRVLEATQTNAGLVYARVRPYPKRNGREYRMYWKPMQRVRLAE